MEVVAPETVARLLHALAEGTLACPFCRIIGSKGVFPSEDGPKLELFEGSIDDADAAGLYMTHQVYCGKEDRNFAVVYRPASPLPDCPECESSFDVVADPPESCFVPDARFIATARCASCETPIGPIAYEAFDFRDRGRLGN